MPSTEGYSGKPLARKLGLEPGMRLLAIAAPAHYETLLDGANGAGLDQLRSVGDAAAPADAVHLFVGDKAELAASVRPVLDLVAPGGMLWVSWPKKSSPLFRDLTEDGLREALLPTGWVDVKVAAVDRDWSGLKFLRRRS